MILLAAIVAVTNALGTVSVDTYGARIVSYVTRTGREVMAKTSSPGVGGWMLCWPWFGDAKPCDAAPRHGLARYGTFRVVEQKEGPLLSELVLRMDSDEKTRRFFPHDFALTVRIRLSEGLSVEMTGVNVGREPFIVTEAFHPYFAVKDATRCRIEGLADVPVQIDCRGSRDFRIEGEGRRFCLWDDGAGHCMKFTCNGASGVRVWNPGPSPPKGKHITPLGADDWKTFVCVEPGTPGSDGYVLKPGESHTLSMSCARLNPRSFSTPRRAYLWYNSAN